MEAEGGSSPDITVRGFGRSGLNAEGDHASFFGQRGGLPYPFIKSIGRVKRMIGGQNQKQAVALLQNGQGCQRNGRCRIAGLGFEDNRAVQAVFLKRGTDIEAVIFVADDHGLSCVGCRHGPAQSVFEQRMTAFQRHELFRVCSP